MWNNVMLWASSLIMCTFSQAGLVPPIPLVEQTAVLLGISVFYKNLEQCDGLGSSLIICSFFTAKFGT